LIHDRYIVIIASLAHGCKQDTPEKGAPCHPIARKLARHVASARPVPWGLERIVSVLEQRYPSPKLLRPLYRWVIGGYIFRGYREGLREGHR